MIAALYVLTNGPYFGLPDVEPWDVTRDARQYAGPYPCVLHPPCERWGRYWSGGPSARVRRLKGDDGGCFAAALAAVRKWGGYWSAPRQAMRGRNSTSRGHQRMEAGSATSSLPVGLAAWSKATTGIRRARLRGSTLSRRSVRRNSSGGTQANASASTAATTRPRSADLLRKDREASDSARERTSRRRKRSEMHCSRLPAHVKNKGPTMAVKCDVFRKLLSRFFCRHPPRDVWIVGFNKEGLAVRKCEKCGRKA